MIGTEGAPTTCPCKLRCLPPGRADAGRTSLHRHASQGDAAGLRRSLQQRGGLSVDERDENDCTPLHLAAMNGSEACISELLAAGGERGPGGNAAYR